MSSTDYENLTKTELRDEVDARGLDVSADASKADLVAALQADDGGETSTELATTEADAGQVDTIQQVDTKDLSTEPLEGEHFLLTGESWVVLGENEAVPEWAVGMPAAVISSPVSSERDDNGDVLYEYTKPDAIIQVRERSQGALLSIPLDSVQKLSLHGGRTAVVNFP